MSERDCTVEFFSVVSGVGHLDEWHALEGLTLDSTVEQARVVLNAAHKLTSEHKLPLYLADKKLADDGLSPEELLASDSKRRLDDGNLRLRKCHEDAGGPDSLHIIADARAAVASVDTAASSVGAAMSTAAAGGAGGPPAPAVPAAPPRAAPINVTIEPEQSDVPFGGTPVLPVSADGATAAATGTAGAAPAVQDEWYRRAETLAALHRADADAMRIVSCLAMPLLRVAHRDVSGPSSAKHDAVLSDMQQARREGKHTAASQLLRTWLGLSAAPDAAAAPASEGGSGIPSAPTAGAAADGGGGASTADFGAAAGYFSPNAGMLVTNEPGAVRSHCHEVPVRQSSELYHLAHQYERAVEQHLLLLTRGRGEKAVDHVATIRELRGSVEQAEHAASESAAAAASSDAQQQTAARLRCYRLLFMTVAKCLWSGRRNPSTLRLTTKLQSMRGSREGLLEFLCYSVLQPLQLDTDNAAAVREAAACFFCQAAPVVQRQVVALEHQVGAEIAAHAEPGVGGRAVLGAVCVEPAASASLPPRSATAADAAPAASAMLPTPTLMPATALLEFVRRWNAGSGDGATLAPLWAAMLNLQLALFVAGPDGAAARRAFIDANGRMGSVDEAASASEGDLLGKLGWIRGSLQAGGIPASERAAFVLGVRPGFRPSMTRSGLPSCWRLQFDADAEQEVMALDSRVDRELARIVVGGTCQLLRLSELTTAATTRSTCLFGIMRITRVERVYPLEAAAGAGRWLELSSDCTVDVPFRLSAALYAKMSVRQPCQGGKIKATLCAGSRLGGDDDDGFQIVAKNVQADVTDKPELHSVALADPHALEATLEASQLLSAAQEVELSDDEDSDPLDAGFNSLGR